MAMLNVTSKKLFVKYIADLQKKRRERRQKQRKILSMLMRNLQLLSIVLSLLTIRDVTTRRVIRSCKRELRHRGWWTLVERYSDVRFKKSFRLTRNTFFHLLEQIRPQLCRNTVSELPWSPEERLAICLYRLGRGTDYYTLAEMSGIGTSTICEIVRETCVTIVDTLWNTYVKQPESEDNFATKMMEMEERWQFPYAWAAVDGCHIPIKCPDGGAASQKEYHNFKNFYSIVLMAMVDSRYRFVWGSCGYPGNSHDAIILQSTNIWERLSDGSLLPPIQASVNNTNVGPIILGDSAFPLRQWLLRPYSNASPTPAQSNFNYRLSRARMVVECCYGQLKGRWRGILKVNESVPEQVKYQTLACLILHNLCIDEKDKLATYMDLTYDHEKKRPRTRAEFRDLLHMTESTPAKEKPSVANKVRDAMCARFWEEKNA